MKHLVVSLTFLGIFFAGTARAQVSFEPGTLSASIETLKRTSIAGSSNVVIGELTLSASAEGFLIDTLVVTACGHGSVDVSHIVNFRAVSQDKVLHPTYTRHSHRCVLGVFRDVVTVPLDGRETIKFLVDLPTSAANDDPVRDGVALKVHRHGIIGVGLASGLTVRPRQMLRRQRTTVLPHGRVHASVNRSGLVGEILTPGDEGYLLNLKLLTEHEPISQVTVVVGSMYTNISSVEAGGQERFMLEGHAQLQLTITPNDEGVYELPIFGTVAPLGVMAPHSYDRLCVIEAQAIGSVSGYAIPIELEGDPCGPEFQFEEVEPIITVSNQSPRGYLAPNTNQTIGVINIEARGLRDLTTQGLTMLLLGNNRPERYLNNVRLWQGATLVADGTIDQQLAGVTFDFSAPLTQTAGNTIMLRVTADTTAIIDNSTADATLALYLPRGGLTWSYQPLNNPSPVIDTASDSDPIFLPMLMYSAN